MSDLKTSDSYVDKNSIEWNPYKVIGWLGGLNATV